MGGQVVGVDRVIAVDLQRPGNSTEATFFDVPVETIMTTDLGVEYFSDKADDFRGKVSLIGWADVGGVGTSLGRHVMGVPGSVQVVVVATNPDTVRKAQTFRNGLLGRWRDPNKVIHPHRPPAACCSSRAHAGRSCRFCVPLHFPFQLGFAMFSRAPVIHGTRLVESELLGDVAGTDVIIIDGKDLLVTRLGGTSALVTSCACVAVGVRLSLCRWQADMIDTANTLQRVTQVLKVGDVLGLAGSPSVVLPRPCSSSCPPLLWPSLAY